MVIEEEGRPLTPDSVGGRLCLDFANTVSQKLSGKSVDDLKSYSDFVTWAVKREILSDQEGEKFYQEALQRPSEASAALNAAKALRTTIYSIFAAIAGDRTPADSDVAKLNKELRKVLTHIQLVKTPTGFEWDWSENEGELDQLLWPVIKSAGDLLVSNEVTRLRKCEGDPCEWLFVDRSKNHSRRWCDMADCGNRAKARRHYARKRATEKV